jgi:PAS domain S-box-containing protein/diguanylate cyclase (GGDEF)-like protein
VQRSGAQPDNSWVTTAPPDVPAPAVGPGPGSGSRPRTVRRPLLLAALAAGVTTAAGLTPGQAGVGVAVSLNFLVVAAVTALLLRWAPGTAHPAGWRWFAASVGIGATGAALAATVLPWGQTALGSVPGQLLVVVAVLHLLDRDSLRGARAQMASLLVLFVVAAVLTAHTTYRLTVAGSGLLSVPETVALFALLCSIAIGIGCVLVMLSVSRPHQQPVAAVLLAAQVSTAVSGAFSSITTGPGVLQALACGLSVFGMGLVSVACRLDRPAPTTASAVRGGSTLGALLPHTTAMLGGSLLLLSMYSTGEITYSGTVLGVLGLGALLAHQTVSWRTEQRLTAELQRSEAYFRTLVRGSIDPVVILDEDLSVRWASPAITGLLGLDPGRMMGLTVADVLHPDDIAGLLAGLDAVAVPSDPETKIRTARVRHVDGRWRLIQAQVRDLRNDPDIGALVLYCRDVTATTPSPVADIDPGAFGTVDPATGLPNRSALTLRVSAALRAPDTRSTSLVLLGVDGLPHTDASVVLRELTTRISRVLRGDDWLARVAVSEFAVLVNGTVADAEVVAARLVGAVGPVASGAGTVRLTAAAGVTPLYRDVDARDALGHADLALRSARAAGPGRVRRHDDALRITQDRRDALRADLAYAMDGDQLHLVYQPVVDLALHRTVSVEALLRWHHPVYGDVSPGEFIPLAEESTLITELGRWVLGQATATVADLPYPDLGVAVNVSARHIRGGELVGDVLTALDHSGLPASRLVLEITESVLLDDSHVTADLEALRRLGVRIAVDDFGTGWSSLAYLVGLPIDVLKMDRQFLAHVETDPQRRALCSSVLHLGNSLGLTVVVEGVETAAELQLLRDMGHRFIQGFLLARPVKAAVLARGLPVDTAATTADVPPPPAGARFPRNRT